MKYKLKEINFTDISFDKTNLNNGTLLSLKYKENSLEFQTPKLRIEALVKENGHEYLVLKIIGTQACKTFCTKIIELEHYFSEYLLKNGSGESIKTIFNEDLFTVKIPFKYSKPLIKVYKNDNLFNYYNLENGMEIICLLSINLWINMYKEPSYNLNVKEIMVI